MTEYANPEVLVDTDWVEQRLGYGSVRLIEVDDVDPQLGIEDVLEGLADLVGEAPGSALRGRSVAPGSIRAIGVRRDGLVPTHEFLFLHANLPTPVALS